MLGLGYISKQTYSFEDYQQILKIIEITGASQYKIEQEQKIIEYTIDRKQWIRLNDLIYWISIRFVRFHFGQLLDLFEKLLLYVLELKQKGIDHQYLDSNRIWLVLRPESEYPSIIHSKLIYDIVFTGYQCSFYENPFVWAMDGTIKIQEIILEIISSFLEQQVGLILNEQQSEQEIQILHNLKKVLLTGNTQTSLVSIQQQKKLNQYNFKAQMLCFDKQTRITCFRKNNIEKIFQFIQDNLKTIIEKKDQLLVEMYLQKMVWKLVLSLFEASLFTPLKLDMNFFNESESSELTSQNNKLKIVLKPIISDQIKLLMLKSSNMYKFEFKNDEISEMVNEILEAILQQKILSYFNNSYFFQSQQNLQKYKMVRISKVIQTIVEDRFQINFQLKLLQLSYELL